MAEPTIDAIHRYSVQNGRGDAIAHIELDERPGAYWVTNLWVDPDHRRTGVATALMQRCITAWAHVDLYLAVQPYTDAPQSADALARWYARFGFAPTDVPGVMYRPAYATNNRKEAKMDINWFNWSAPAIPIRRKKRGVIAYVWLWNLFNRRSAGGHYWGVGVLQIQNRHLLYVGHNGISICFIGRTS